MTTGLETIVDATGCSAGALSDLTVLRGLCERIVGDLELQVIGKPQWHAFPGPGGVTGLYLLSESHLACHTYPEYGLATFNLYCCRERIAWDWRRWLQQILGAERIEVRIVPRGGEASMSRKSGPESTETMPHDRPSPVFAREPHL